MEEFLKLVDESIKRLASPAAIMVGAVVTIHAGRGGGTPSQVDYLLYSIAGFMILWSLIYAFISVGVMIRKLQSIHINEYLIFIAGLSYFFIYASMFIVAINVGLRSNPLLK